MSEAVWVVLYHDPETDEYQYLDQLRLTNVRPDQALESVVDDVFAKVVDGRLYRRRPSDFDIAFYELPKWPCPRSAVLVVLLNAFITTVTTDYLDAKCIRHSASAKYRDVDDTQNLAVILEPRFPDRPLSEDEEEEEYPIIADRETIARAAQERGAPFADDNNNSRVRRIQTPRQPDAVYNFRPPMLSGPSVQIYHPAFATFLHVMDESTALEFTPEELQWAQDLIIDSLDYHLIKGERKKAMRPMAPAAHPQVLNATELDLTPCGTIKPDGVVFSSAVPHGVTFVPVIGVHEIRADMGEGGDPLLQAERHYASIYSSDEARAIRRISPCPCILMATTGPNIIVSGAVFADRIIATRLTGLISLVPGASEAGESPLATAMRRVARLFRALRVTLKELDEYYTQLVVPSPKAVDPAEPAPYVGPWFTQFVMDGIEVKLEYTGPVSPHHPSRAVFKALAHTGSGEPTPVVVKFVRTYSREGHLLLAHADPPLAPRLWYCDRLGNTAFYVVVMDHVEDCERELSADERAALRRAVELLHGHGLVFGDLRAPNVLRLPEGGVRLVDFEWCGKEGEVRYPFDIYTSQEMPWHKDVHRGGLITKEHDLHLLELLAPSK